VVALGLTEESVMSELQLRIGNQTSRHAARPMEPYEFALKHDFDAFEWFSDKERSGWNENDMDPSARRMLRQTAGQKEIRFSVHAPWRAAPFTPEGSSSIHHSLEFAGDIGAGVVNIHLYPERGLDTFATALAPLLEHAQRVGVQISIENTPQTTPDDFNRLFTVLASLKAGGCGVGMCFDMGHANLCATTRNDYIGYLDRLGAHVPIIHWHAHENWGDRDSHLPLFTGPSAQNDAGLRALVKRLRQQGFRGAAILEQWPVPPEKLVTVRERLRMLCADSAG
jgi:sugar phosphate isomerase/epimerase